MIFIFGVIRLIIQKNTLCTNKIRVIYFYPNCVSILPYTILPFDNFVAADSFRICYQVSYLHCVKSVCIRSYSGPKKCGNTDQNNSEYEHFLRITYYYLHSSQMLTFSQSSKKLDQIKKIAPLWQGGCCFSAH